MSMINGYRNVGYFAQWAVAEADFTVADLDRSGQAANLTHINYSFAHIDPETLTVRLADPEGNDSSHADYGRLFTAEESVDGVADYPDQSLAGNWYQLRKLKSRYPDLKILVSLGGWTGSRDFSTVCATAESRERFVASCIDVIMRGHLPMCGAQGGEEAAAGIFDGLDVDWEWPGTPTGLPGNIVDQEHDAANFTLLLQELRRQLDDFGREVGRATLLTGFAPAHPRDIAAGGWNDPANFTAFDFVNVQGYDLHGTWEANLTGHQSNLYPDPLRPGGEDTSIETTIRAYLDNGVPPHQLNVGIPLYGRGWQGVRDPAAAERGWLTAEGAGPGKTEAGSASYDELVSLGSAYCDPRIGAAWRWDGDQWWTYDDLESAEVKARYVAEHGLGGAMYWALDSNQDGAIVTRVADILRNSPHGSAKVS